jgi:F420 biosynthesis protein FbiB-like protein
MSENFADIIRHRRSVRRFRPDDVPDALLTELLELASWAPSAHNRQPWRFVVVKTAAVRRSLSARMASRLEQSLKLDGLPEEKIKRDVDRSQRRINGAPILIIVCLTMEDMDIYPDDLRTQAEYLMAVQSVAMSGQTLMLAAHASGLSSCWVCAPLFCPDTVREFLDLDASWEPQGVILLGYAAEERSKTRHSIDTRVVMR